MRPLGSPPPPPKKDKNTQILNLDDPGPLLQRDPPRPHIHPKKKNKVLHL